jgi:protein gp37
MEIKSVWDDLARCQKLAAAAGEVHRVFVGSMMDIFEKPMPLVDGKGNRAIVNGVAIDTDDLRNALFESISLGLYPNLLFLFLTKRPSNINKYIPESWKENPPENVMFGCSPVNQATADKLIPQLLELKGKRFLSCEPLLGPIEFSDVTKRSDAVMQLGKKSLNGIDWLIVGGESGHGARPMHPDWARSIRDQCKYAGVPFFFKQWGEWIDFENMPSEYQLKLKRGEANHRIVNIELNPPFIYTAHLLGKKAAGRLLDGQEYSELPK